jgi:carbon-monoxide dehydrogenase medium subunit
MDIAVVGVGAAVTLDASLETITAARIALGAVAPTPLLAEQAGRLLVGRKADAAAFHAAAAAAREIISPITDMRGTREFREHVTGVLVERVLSEAVERARASQGAGK